MRKASLHFDLKDGDYDLKCALHGHDFYSALSEIQQYIRNRLKHESPSDEACKDLEHIRSLLPPEYWSLGG